VGLELGSEGEKRNSKFSESSGSSDSDSESVLFRTIGQRRVRHIPNLRDDELRHPLDRQNTQLISLVPGIEGIVNAMISPMSEEVALLENIGTSVLVSEDQLPDIHALLVDAANLLQVRETRCSIVLTRTRTGLSADLSDPYTSFGPSPPTTTTTTTIKT